MNLFLNIFIFSMLLFSCNNNDKSLKEDSILIYSEKNFNYNKINDSKHSINLNERNKTASLSGNIELEKTKIFKKLKSKIKNKIVDSNSVFDEEFIFYLTAEQKIIKRNLDNLNEFYELRLSNKKNNYLNNIKKISIFDNLLLVSFGDKTLFLIDKNNLSLIKKYSASNIVKASNEIDSKYIYFVTIDNQIYALEIDSGKIIWKFSMDPKQTSILGTGHITIHNNSLIYSSSNGITIVIDKLNGNLIWSSNINKLNTNLSEFNFLDFEKLPLINNNQFINWSYSKKIVSYDLLQGIKLWDIDAQPITNLWHIDNVIYTLTDDLKLIAINKKNGSLIWFKDLIDEKKININKYNKTNISNIFILNGKLSLISKKGELASFDPINGEFMSKINFAKNIVTLPYYYKDKLYFQDEDGTIIIYN